MKTNIKVIQTRESQLQKALDKFLKDTTNEYYYPVIDHISQISIGMLSDEYEISVIIVYHFAQG